MKIAIASSGLGHITRGIETWAADTAVAVSQLLSCQVAELLSKESPKGSPTFPSTTQQLSNSTTVPATAGTPREAAPSTTHSTHNVTLFAGAPLPQPVNCHVVVLPCRRRNNWTTQQLISWAPGWTWRWGWKSGYDIEQRSFWRHLWPILRDEGYDILHVQDPLLADLCRRYRKAGKLRTKEILAHGTEESVEFLEKFEYVQHLAPWHLEQTLKQIEEKRGLHH